MMNHPKLLILLIPAAAFISLVVFFISRLPQPAPAVTSSPSSTVNPPSSIPTPTPSSLQILVDQIAAFKTNDSTLTPPSFDIPLQIPNE